MNRLLFSTFFFSLFCIGTTYAQDDAIGNINNMSLWELILSVHWTILIVLVLLSVAVIALIIFNFFWLRSDNICSQSFEEAATSALKSRNLEKLLSACRDHDTEACARVLLKTVSFAKANPGVGLAGLKEISETEASRLAGKIARPSTLVMDLGVLGPLVGLLGTVIGILKSFGNLASDATPMKTMLLAGGVSEALVATAMGLSIGLLGMGFYAYFRQRVAGLIGFFESILTEFVVKTTECLSQPKSSSAPTKTTEAPTKKTDDNKSEENKK